MATPRPRPTMRDVAALAGVSLKTVSRVINGETTVAEDLVGRVRVAADQLGYQPNLAASALRRSDGSTQTIGLLLEDVANPFSAALHRAVEDVARERGVGVLAGSLDEQPERERAVVRDLVGRRVDGLIIVPPATSDQSYLAQEMRSGLRVVFIDRPPHLLDADTVLSTNREGAAEATAHLISAGHRRIGFLGDLTTIATETERFAGYSEALRDADIGVDPHIVRHDLPTSELAERAVLDLMDSPFPPTALFASQNLVCVGAIRALRALDRHHDTALVGFDDFLLADLLEPAVTVVAQDPRRIGHTAATRLFERLDGDESPSSLVRVPTRLIVRGSGEIAPPEPVRG